jgi:flagellar biosynthetic protein FliR
MTVRAAIAVALVALVGPLIVPLMPPPPPDPLGTASMVAAEILTGLWIGWLARLLLIAMPLAGQIIASVIGLANVLQPDAALGGQTSALSRLLGLVAPTILFTSGLYLLPVEALVGSYRLIAPGAVLPAGDTAETVLRSVSACFGLGLRLAAPFILAGTIWHVALGVLGRLVPNLQVFFLSAPGQIFGGLLLLAVLSGALLETWHEQMASFLAALPGL